MISHRVCGFKDFSNPREEPPRYIRRGQQLFRGLLNLSSGTKKELNDQERKKRGGEVGL